MKRLSLVILGLSLTAVSCSSNSNPTNPVDPNTPTFTATLMPANEVPPVSNAENTGSGNVTVTFQVTRDSAGNITAGTATFVVTLQGFPPNTPINIAHIHQAPAGSNGQIVFSTQLTQGEVTLANGGGSFTKAGVPPSGGLEIMNAIINNPSGFYFNVHSTLNPAGVARGQLVRVQ